MTLHWFDSTKTNSCELDSVAVGWFTWMLSEYVNSRVRSVRGNGEPARWCPGVRRFPRSPPGAAPPAPFALVRLRLLWVAVRWALECRRGPLTHSPYLLSHFTSAVAWKDPPGTGASKHQRPPGSHPPSKETAERPIDCALHPLLAR